MIRSSFWKAFALVLLLTTTRLVVVVRAENILWVTIAGHSASRMMAASARDWLKTHPQHTMTFLAYGNEQSTVESTLKQVNFQSFGAPGPLASKDRDEAARRLNEQDNIEAMGYLLELMAEPYENEVQVLDKIVKDIQPDMVVVDMFATSALDYLAFHGHLYVVFYHCSALGIMGIEDSFAVPDMLSGKTLAQRSFWDRLLKVVSIPKLILATAGATAKLNAGRKRLGFPTYGPPDTNIAGRPIIAVTSFGFDYARRLSPLVMCVGFVVDMNQNRMTATTKSDKSLMAWLDHKKSSLPVVYASFGTEVTLTTRLLHNLIQGTLAAKCRLLIAARPKALAAGNVNIKDLIEQLDEANGVMVRHDAWAKQPMVLSHDAVKVFVTHGGTSSIAEAIYAHVPMIFIPSGADRNANAARMVDKAGAVWLDFNTITSQNVTDSVNQLKDNVTAIERLEWIERINKQAGGGSPEAARKLQHILEDGYEHLVQVETQLGFLAANSYDLALFFVAVVLLNVLICYKFVTFICCHNNAGKSKRDNKTKVQ